MAPVQANIQPLLAQLEAHMEAKSYAARTRANYVHYVSRFLEHLAQYDIAIEVVTTDDVEQYMKGEQQRYSQRHGARPSAPEYGCGARVSGIHQLLRVVRGQWPPLLAPSTPLEAVSRQICQEYAHWLLTYRGLAMATISGRCDEAARFLTWLGERSDPDRMLQLTSNDIDGYLTFRADRLSRRSRKSMASLLRAFVSFLHSTGRITRNLAPFVMVPKLYALETIPSALREAEVRAVTAAAHQDQSPKGLRDYAILLLLATYGLRDWEVVHLKLDDVDWRTDRLYIRRSKTRTESCLPLLSAVGEALLAYLRNGRPKTPAREIFIRVCAPYRPLCSVYATIQRRLDEANIHPAGKHGAHAFRHARAVGLLRADIPIKQIGDILGHRCAASTSIYLKLATEDLRTVALEIPSEVVPS